jgi:Aspartyl/asparaginyl beta-hydroxylase and related dioxygenases
LKLIIIAVYVLSIAYVHLRGKVRHKLGRQLSDHSTFLAPINCFLYLFSKVPSQPYLKPGDFPELQPLQEHWQEIREEARNLMTAGAIKRSEQPNDVGFNSFSRAAGSAFT